MTTKEASIDSNTTNSENKKHQTKIEGGMIKTFYGFMVAYEFHQSEIYCQSKAFPFRKDS